MIRTPYRRRVPIDTLPVQKEVQSPRSVLEDLEEEVDLDLESTARSKPKSQELEDTIASSNGQPDEAIPAMMRTLTSLPSSCNNEAVRCGTLSKGSEKRKEVEETNKQGGSRNDNKRVKVGKGFVAAAPLSNEYDGSYPKCTKCFTHHLDGAPCQVCYNCQKLGHIARDYRTPVKQLTLVNAIRMEWKSFTNEVNRNTRNHGNQARGRAFNMNAVGTLQDPKVVTGTFSLNDHFVTVLFDSGADFSFISTKSVSLLNVKPSIVKLGYVIEVADGKNVQVDRIIRGCKLELGNSMLTVDLIPLGYGSFDVIVGMDWLSEQKA
ncbi:putative reverse transcriptase domain-containing protein, partial [Tanacetum coccineum]